MMSCVERTPPPPADDDYSVTHIATIPCDARVMPVGVFEVMCVCVCVCAFFSACCLVGGVGVCWCCGLWNDFVCNCMTYYSTGECYCECTILVSVLRTCKLHSKARLDIVGFIQESNFIVTREFTEGDVMISAIPLSFGWMKITLGQTNDMPQQY